MEEMFILKETSSAISQPIEVSGGGWIRDEIDHV